jgi:hypothetical protein
MTAGHTQAKPAPRSLLVGAIFLAVIVAIQWSVGAYQSEQGIYSDDAAHFMNGLLVRDYVAEGLGQNPIAFAVEYYSSYPKIAPGMWPPLFHIGLGLFLLPHWPPHGAALFLIALLCAWAAWRLSRMVSLFANRPAGFVAGLLFLTTPVVVSLTTSIMLDVVLAALAIEAAYWLARFMQSEQPRHAALFGLFTAMCCLTKGNGVSLVFAPLAAILVTGRFDLLRRSGLYLAAAIVVAIAAPPLMVTYRLDAAIGDFGPITPDVVWHRIRYYGGYIWTQLGPSATVLALIGLADSIRHARRWQAHSPLPLAQALTALVAGSVVFHLFNPHILAQGRYMTLAIAPLCGLSIVGVQACGRFINGSRRQTINAALMTIMVVTTFFARPALAVRKPFGYGDMATQLEQRGGVSGKRILVVSDETGEGALVTEVAIRQPQPRPMIVRGSKLLGSDNWNGHNFVMRYTSPQAVIQELEDLHVDYVVIDSAPEAMRLPYWPLIQQMLQSYEDRVQLEYHNTVDRRQGPTRPLALYRLKYQSSDPPKPPQLELPASIQRLLKR